MNTKTSTTQSTNDDFELDAVSAAFIADFCDESGLSHDEAISTLSKYAHSY